ncbi:MAG: hypothetical protein ACK5JS_08970 [Mangrovibacterium sp.]
MSSIDAETYSQSAKDVEAAIVSSNASLGRSAPVEEDESANNKLSSIEESAA